MPSSLSFAVFIVTRQLSDARMPTAVLPTAVHCPTWPRSSTMMPKPLLLAIEDCTLPCPPTQIPTLPLKEAVTLRTLVRELAAIFSPHSHPFPVPCLPTVNCNGIPLSVMPEPVEDEQFPAMVKFCISTVIRLPASTRQSPQVSKLCVSLYTVFGVLSVAH